MGVFETGRTARTRLGASAAALAFALAGAAQAQSTGNGSGTDVPGAPAAPAIANAGPATGDSTGVAEVVVTAQRRAESLQSVPLSVEAISGAAVLKADLTDAPRLEQVVPGLRVGRSGPATRPAIRGVYTEAIGINADPRIGFYIDEIYQSRTQQGDAAFVDLERVEVQKGPQGTLFGRNSLGGNIALTSATPKDHYEGGLDLVGGNYNRGKIEGFFNAPIAPGLDFRIAGSAEAHDGYVQSTVSSKADLEDKNDYFVRGSLKWVPPQLDGKLEVLLHASYFNERDRGYGSFNAKTIGALVDPSLITIPGGTLTFNGITYPFANGYNGGNYYTGTVYPYTTAFRDNIPDVGGADIGLPITGKYKVPYDFHDFQRLKEQNYSGSVSYDINRFIRLRSITGYTDFSTIDAGESDGTPIPYSEFYNITKAQTFTQEFQLQSNDKKSPLQYTVGGYYLYDKDDDANATIYTHVYSTATAAANGYPVLYNNGGGCGYTFLPNLTSCALNNMNAADSLGPEHAETQSYAAYAQASYTVMDKLTFTLGARYTIDHKNFKNIAQTSDFVGTYVLAQNQAFFNANPTAPQSAYPFPNGATKPVGSTTFTPGLGYHAEFPLTGDANATPENLHCAGLTAGTFANYGSNAIVGAVPDYYTTRCGTRDFEFATYRAAVDYKLTPRNLLYGSFSTGRHSGGFGASYATSAIPQGAFGTYNSEGVEAWEVGSKNQFLDGRFQVNLAAFYNNYSHVQIQGLQFIPALNGSITTIYNGPSEHAPGVDLEMIAKPWRALTLTFAVNYLHARYQVYGQPIYYSGLCTISSGAASPCGSSFSGATYYQTQGGLGSGFFPNPLTNPALFIPATTNAAGVTTSYFSLINGRKTEVQNTPDWSLHYGASYDFDLGRFGRVTPEFLTIYSSSYLLSASIPNFRQNDYMKTDARVTWTSPNGKLTAQAFVENLENVPTLDRVTTGSLAVQGTYGDPRTYGIKLGYRFY